MRVTVRSPAVAGLFYPEDPVALQRMIDQFLQVPGEEISSDFKAFISPHAGFIYSGPIAAQVYRQLPGRKEIRRVILLGPSHRVPLAGMALSTADYFETPLGRIPVDQAAREAALACAAVAENDLAHQFEHSLEVQLPFLQRVLDQFSILPVVVGNTPRDLVAQLLEMLWGGDETLVIVSSDLSHYLPYPEANARDRETAETILALRPELDGDEACGCFSVNGLLLRCRQSGLKGELLGLANSGDTAGDRQRVVGYGAFGFRKG